jgi:hypothetical protein
MTDNLELFKDFRFIQPDPMVDNDLELQVKELSPYNPDKGYVPG